MPPIDEFENKLRGIQPRPLASSAYAAVEAKLQESESQRSDPKPQRSVSRAALVGVWASGFAIGAAAMLLVAPWLVPPRETSGPSISDARPHARLEHQPIVATSEDAPAERLVSLPGWTPQHRMYSPSSAVLTVGSDLRTMADWPEIPSSLRRVPGQSDATVPDEITRDHHHSHTPTTRRELIDQILNEA
ncbi:hypothetical protein [Allorhodopirellula heiligendammensis]|uniref:Uncharacterized protein n=1 Tax=Allorhodopirellula heiligendammensis TaxID=2714739 RepID=A0A5C6C396_9BACT|nr:hypothetical protein [Allorhodopirellula heiligendammensis]TWU18487.1 hypothetical protein Poly21_06500 [Allorhodopirellula heiligendammensis]